MKYTKYLFNNSIICENNDDGIVVYFPAASSSYVLNSTASFIFKLLQQNVAISEIVLLFQDKYNLNFQFSYSEVKAFITYLHNERILSTNKAL